MDQISGRLVSLQVGRPKTFNFEGDAWRTGIYKSPVSERLQVSQTNLDGDRQANTRVHGGPDKAVCCYASEHYPYWREILEVGDTFVYGAFGENFTLENMTEPQVCIGDIYAVGTAQMQVSQPRQPCINVVRKWKTETLPQQMIEKGFTGFYLRVLQTGEVGAGDTLTLLERPCPDLTIAAANEAAYLKAGGREFADYLANLPELSQEWRRIFRRRLGKE